MFTQLFKSLIHRQSNENRRIRVLLLLLLIAVSSLIVAGCELEDPDADADQSDTQDEAGMDATSDADMADQDMEVSLDYRFVRIDDLSEQAAGPDGGADIDAVILDKPDGQPVYADAVESFTFGFGEGEELDPTEALGAPDAFDDYPDTSTCIVEGGFVSLGGMGGQLILHMADTIEQGDTLTVLEVGNCDIGGGKDAIQDDVEVFVSVAADDSRDWVALGNGGVSPDITFTIPALPFEAPE